jgi:antitoxin VapB
MIDINGVYQQRRIPVSETGTAKLFMHGRSQAVRLPKAFRMPGTEVRVRRVGKGVMLEPMANDEERIKAIFAELDRLGAADFLPEGRPEQPPMPEDDFSFDDIDE